MRYSVILTLLILVSGTFVIAGPEPGSANTGDFFSIHWHAAIRGYDFDGDGDDDWCDTRGPNGWHGSDDGIDQQSRTGSSSCYAASGNWVDFAAKAYLSTSRQVSWAYALRVQEYEGVYGDSCDYVHFDSYGYGDGRYRGRERIIHAADDYSQGATIFVAALKNGWQTNFWKVGGLTNDSNCGSTANPPFVGWTGYHAHQGHQTSCTGYQRGSTGYYNEK